MKWANETRSRRFSRRTKADVVREAKERNAKECTFKPKINGRARFSTKTNQETRQERFTRLSSTHELREQKLFKERTRMEQKEMEQCTFKPKINPTSKTISSSSSHYNTKEGIARLHGEADARSLQRQKLKRKIEAEELESYPFKPSINRKSEKMLDMSHYKPIHLRVNDIQRAKHASRLAERLSRDASNPNLTFQPKINETSKMLVESKRMDTTDPSQFDVTSRLMKDAHDSTRRTLKRQQEYAKEKASQLTFQPHMSRGSQEIINSKSDYMGPGSNFIARQATFQKRKQKERNLQIQKEMKNSECTFHPDTGSAAEVLRHTRPHRLNESNLERVERLYRQDVQNKETKIAALRKRHQADCTFKPQINEISKSLARSKTVQELMENRKNRQIKHESAAKREQEIAAECTFQPKVNTSNKAKSIVKNLPASQFRVNVNEPEKIVKAIDVYRKDREMKLRQTRQEVEYESMKECTFAPDTHGHKGKGMVAMTVVNTPVFNLVVFLCSCGLFF